MMIMIAEVLLPVQTYLKRSDFIMISRRIYCFMPGMFILELSCTDYLNLFSKTALSPALVLGFRHILHQMKA